ncbi:MAG: T9SS type A sorting domain-containing protein [Candidatus Hatepunaea meridiana]|nr:T9SS type A sorting domain-containing protein [Candidatus Hatepunaea meridiana]
MKPTAILSITLCILSIATCSLARNDEPQTQAPLAVSSNDAIRLENRVHRGGNVWINITNRGVFGNYSEGRLEAMRDPETPYQWAPQCEFPGGSGNQYLFIGTLWIGALVRAEGYEYPRVSVGTDGWIYPEINEMLPGEGENDGIIEHSNVSGALDYLGNAIYSPDAVATQEFIATYSDTSIDPLYVYDDPTDGEHHPLGLKVTQKSMSWDSIDLDDFIIIEWEIENISGNYLKNLYIGLYVDGDVGHRDNTYRHFDDLCGYRKWYYFQTPEGELDSSEINIAWIADNDGRLHSIDSGTDFEAPGVAGTMVLQSPNPDLTTSFNWWISNGDPDLDYGPSWKDDDAPGGWTDVYGTPMGDEKKYFLLSNRENDFDQVYCSDFDYIRDHPQIFRSPYNPEDIIEMHDWKIPSIDDATPSGLVHDLSNGYDTRYMISWGPLGVFDRIDDAGNRIYRLNPGEKFSMTIAYVCGDNFHDANNPQPTNEVIDPSKFSFTDLCYNCFRARNLYENDYLTDYPHKPRNFRAVPGFKSIWLAWDKYINLPGTLVDIYRGSSDEEGFDETPINDEPIEVNYFEVKDAVIGQHYIYRANAVRWDSLYSRYSDTAEITVGILETPTGLDATGGNGFVDLIWNPNPESNLDHYIVGKQYYQDDSLHTEISEPAFEEEFTDSSVTNGVKYRYYITAVSVHNVYSSASHWVETTPMGFYDDLLVINEEPERPRPGMFDWDVDSVRIYYERLFSDIGENPDFMTIDQSVFPTLVDLSPYRTIWIIHDNYSWNCYNFDVKEQILNDYLVLGGRIIISGRRVFYGSFGYRYGWFNHSGIFHDYFKLDTTYNTNGQDRSLSFIGTSLIHSDYPHLELDTSKAAQILIHEDSFLYTIDGMVPTAEGEILYTYESTQSDSCSLQGLAVGVRYIGENTATAIFTFPLYAMQPYDSVKALAVKVLEDVRSAGSTGETISERDYELSTGLSHIYPNPFNDRTIIGFKLLEERNVVMQVFDITGRQVYDLIDDRYDAGIYQVTFDASELPAGIYFIKLITDRNQITKKVILLR